jgi:hypothetical protein
MKLDHSFSFVATLKEPPVAIGPGPFGMRMFFEIDGGKVEGPDLNGRMLSGGGDWILIGADGFGRIDVRGQMTTDDGASIYVQYHGILEMNEAVMGKLADMKKSTDFGDQYFRSAPRLETGDPRYAWVNHTIFVAEGRMPALSGVEYRVYRVR